MTFWEHFLRLLPRRPKPALAALYWHLTRRKVRARNRLRVASADLQFAYDAWIERVERTPDRADEFRDTMKEWRFHPKFSILLHGAGEYDAAQLARSVASIERQVYVCWKLTGTPVDDIQARIGVADGDFLIPLRVGDALSETALFRFAEAMQANPSATILYGDHDHLDHQGRRTRPWFKPSWNEELFFAQDYLSPAVAIRANLAQGLREDERQNLDSLLLAATSAAKGAIVRVPQILCHVGPRDRDHGRRLVALARHLQARGATCSPGPFDTTKVVWPLPEDLPAVSVIIPTRDKLNLLRPCVESVMRHTQYANFEILIVDNGSVDRRTADYFAAIQADPRVRVIRYPGAYNFSAINNFAVRNTKGSYLCLLNNDTEVVEGSWLSEMMRYAVRPDVGAVGAKLLYGDGTIQHAGVVVGIGGAAGHAHRFLSADSPGYFRMAHVAQFISAVTAACLVVDKGKYIAVGGLDEQDLAVAFNDVDFCLKLESAGWRNVYVPHAVLLHHESKSRGQDSSPLNIDRYRREFAVLEKRWGTRTYDDPVHNPNLDRYSETFVLRV